MTLPATARIRATTSADAAAVAAFAARTFEETFGPDNRPEDMAAFLGTHFTTATLEEQLLDRDTVTLILEVGAGIIGWAQIRRGAVPPGVEGPDPIELRRFYIDRPWHGRGAADHLMTGVFASAKDLRGRTLWLSVWERNPRAIAFYRRRGFVIVGKAPFVLGADVQTDLIMARPID